MNEEKITTKYNNWVENVLIANQPKGNIFIYLPECGLGDKITCFPAFRYLKKLNPDKKIILVTEEFASDIWRLNKYIDFIIPQEYLASGPESIFLRDKLDTGKICNWSFFEHHQKHVVKSCVEKITGEIPNEKTIDLTYEFNLSAADVALAEASAAELLKKAGSKKLIAIAPANTMLSRMWPGGYWFKLVELLQKENYYVVSLGGNNDLDIKNVDLDKRNKYPIRLIPRILDVFDYLIEINSGMLHIGSVNQDIKMVHLNTGQYPEKIMLPFRANNDIYHNRIVINHSCPEKYDCFFGHITEREIDKQSEEYNSQFMLETGEKLM